MKSDRGYNRFFPPCLRNPFINLVSASFLAMAAVSLCMPQQVTAMTIHTAEETIAKAIDQDINEATVKVFNGAIKVDVTPQKNTSVEIVKRGSGYSPEEAKADLKNIDVQINVKGRRLDIMAKRLDDRTDRPNSGASASLKVPPGTNLTLVSSNGEIEALGPLGNINATSSNNHIQIVGAKGHLTLETSNDPINVDGGSGELVLKTSNGDITVISKKVKVVAETSNASISFEGRLQGGTNKFSTSNDDISLTLEGKPDFNLDAETSNGEINSDFKLLNQAPQEDETVLKGKTTANPGVKIICRTSNSDINIKKK